MTSSLTLMMNYMIWKQTTGIPVVMAEQMAGIIRRLHRPQHWRVLAPSVRAIKCRYMPVMSNNEATDMAIQMNRIHRVVLVGAHTSTILHTTGTFHKVNMAKVKISIINSSETECEFRDIHCTHVIPFSVSKSQVLHQFRVQIKCRIPHKVWDNQLTLEICPQCTAYAPQHTMVQLHR